jgi:hypothetical protein
VTHKLLVARLTNAFILSGLSAWLALSYGSAAWANVVWFQSILVFLPLITLGYNEGFGLKLARNQELEAKAPEIFKYNLIVSVCVLLPLTVGYQVIKFPLVALLLPFSLAGLLNFSLLRMYFRSTGNIDGLVNFYFINSALLTFSGLLMQTLSDPMWFVVFISTSQIISSSVSLSRASGKTSISSHAAQPNSIHFRDFSKAGLSLMLSGLLIEGVFHIDRLVLALGVQTQDISLVGVATLVSKGGFMTLSVINVINYRNIANNINAKSKADVIEILKGQTYRGTLLAVGLLAAGVFTTSHEWFRTAFPSYRGLDFFILWQGLFLLSFSLMIPLTTFLNLLQGGAFHLLVMTVLFSLSAIVAVTFAYHGLPMSAFYIALNALLLLSAFTMFSKVYRELDRWQ